MQNSAFMFAHLKFSSSTFRNRSGNGPSKGFGLCYWSQTVFCFFNKLKRFTQVYLFKASELQPARATLDHCTVSFAYVFVSLPSSALGSQSMVERSYNAYAVKVQDASPSTTDSASVYSTLNGNIKSVVPVGDAHGESAEGDLCVEIRVRLYHDGVMSKLLERLTNVSAELMVFGRVDWEKAVPASTIEACPRKNRCEELLEGNLFNPVSS